MPQNNPKYTTTGGELHPGARPVRTFDCSSGHMTTAVGKDQHDTQDTA